jgi:hypothetical protein
MSSVFKIALVFTVFGCARAQSPADAIALGRAHPCTNGGTWDGLECATPHEQPAADEPAAPTDHPKQPSRKRAGAMAQPANDPCECEADDPLCSCE